MLTGLLLLVLPGLSELSVGAGLLNLGRLTLLVKVGTHVDLVASTPVVPGLLLH